jgi:hypothetical protein
VLEGFERGWKILFVNAYDAQQVVHFGVRGIALQLFLDFAFGVGDAAFAEQRFRVG